MEFFQKTKVFVCRTLDFLFPSKEHIYLFIFILGDWKFCGCNLDTVKTERNVIKLISRMYQNFRVWSKFWYWNRWCHAFCLAMKNMCGTVSNKTSQSLWIFLLVHEVFLCYLTDEFSAFTVKLKEMSPPFPYPVFLTNLLCLSMHLKSARTLFCGCTAYSKKMYLAYVIDPKHNHNPLKINEANY